MSKVRVCIAGVTGWTGSALAQGILNDPELELVAGVARKQAGSTIPNSNAPIFGSVQEALKSDKKFDVLVDYTAPSVVKQHALEAIEANVNVIVGTSGLFDQDFEEISKKINQTGGHVGVI